MKGFDPKSRHHFQVEKLVQKQFSERLPVKSLSIRQTCVVPFSIRQGKFTRSAHDFLDDASSSLMLADAKKRAVNQNSSEFTNKKK